MARAALKAELAEIESEGCRLDEQLEQAENELAAAERELIAGVSGSLAGREAPLSLGSVEPDGAGGGVRHARRTGRAAGRRRRVLHRADAAGLRRAARGARRGVTPPSGRSSSPSTMTWAAGRRGSGSTGSSGLRPRPRPRSARCGRNAAAPTAWSNRSSGLVPERGRARVTERRRKWHRAAPSRRRPPVVDRTGPGTVDGPASAPARSPARSTDRHRRSPLRPHSEAFEAADAATTPQPPSPVGKPNESSVEPGARRPAQPPKSTVVRRSRSGRCSRQAEPRAGRRRPRAAVSGARAPTKRAGARRRTSPRLRRGKVASTPAASARSRRR